MAHQNNHPVTIREMRNSLKAVNGPVATPNTASVFNFIRFTLGLIIDYLAQNQGSAGTIGVAEGGVFQGVASILNFNDNLTASVVSGVATIDASGGGGISNVVNVGDGDGLFRDITGNTANFKSLLAGANVTLTDNGDDITIAASGGGGTFNIVLDPRTGVVPAADFIGFDRVFYQDGAGLMELPSLPASEIGVQLSVFAPFPFSYTGVAGVDIFPPFGLFPPNPAAATTHEMVTFIYIDEDLWEVVGFVPFALVV